MGTILEQLPEGSRVALIRLRSLGDCVLTTPAIAILQRSRPDLRIAVVVEERFAAVFDGNPAVETLLAPLARDLAAWRPALALNLHGGTRSMGLTLRSGARFRAGFAHHRHSYLYNVKIPTAQEVLGVSRRVHTAEHLASAMFYLGVERCEIPRAALFASPAPAAVPYAVLHPMASEAAKTWPADSFLAVARHLRERWGLEPVFIAAAGEDASAFGAYRVVAGAPLAEVKTLIAGAAAFVGNDSGPAHMAAAFGLPAVVIFGNSDAEVWAPWKAPAEALVARGPISSVTPAEAIAALERQRVTA
ncbi:MAG TPA: glycosyltransferase family 9 protein [Bryobacteraceae bacterium]|nr:glycosyltransferase family 9 protein [Bryobacteraceae bacterium]